MSGKVLRSIKCVYSISDLVKRLNSVELFRYRALIVAKFHLKKLYIILRREHFIVVRQQR